MRVLGFTVLVGAARIALASSACAHGVEDDGGSIDDAGSEATGPDGHGSLHESHEGGAGGQDANEEGDASALHDGAGDDVTGDDASTGVDASTGADAGSDAESTEGSGDDGPPPNVAIVFLSSQTYQGGSLGGLAGADSACQSLAMAASLPGTFKAWLSDSTTDAATRLQHRTTPYALPDGTTTVASGWSQLASGALSHAIDMTEAKAAGPSARTLGAGTVWTGTTAQGASAGSANCQDWTQPDYAMSSFHPGNSGHTDTAWTLNSGMNWSGTGVCQHTAPIYCVQD